MAEHFSYCAISQIHAYDCVHIHLDLIFLKTIMDHGLLTQIAKHVFVLRKLPLTCWHFDTLFTKFPNFFLIYLKRVLPIAANPSF